MVSGIQNRLSKIKEKPGTDQISVWDEIDLEEDFECRTRQEEITVIRKMKNKRAPGPDDIVQEVVKAIAKIRYTEVGMA